MEIALTLTVASKMVVSLDRRITFKSFSLECLPLPFGRIASPQVVQTLCGETSGPGTFKGGLGLKIQNVNTIAKPVKS